MRLSIFEIETIIKLKNKYFGKLSNMYLFGSRLDDKKKGGDIDLYLDKEFLTQKDMENKINFLLELKSIIGEQKIDLIFSKDKSKPIELEAIKGTKLSIENIKLTKYFNECDKHLQRIEEAFSDIKDSIPLTVDRYNTLTKDDVQAIDQYLYRFSKLQDTLGDKIFKLMLNIYHPFNQNIPFLDILHKLEKYDLITSAKEWLYLREVRNKIAHQYDDEPYEMTKAINDIFQQKEILKAIYIKIKDKYIS